MRHTTCLLAFLLISFTFQHVMAQESKAPDEKPTPSATTETEEPRSEVDKMLEEARARGETIVGARCVGDCIEGSSAADDGAVEGRVLRLPKPKYPLIARRARVSGAVEVKVIIDFDGQVIAASSISGHPLLRAASVEAARNTLFAPTTLEGKPVKVVGVIRYTFIAQ
jgi:TonB family protein